MWDYLGDLYSNGDVAVKAGFWLGGYLCLVAGAAAIESLAKIAGVVGKGAVWAFVAVLASPLLLDRISQVRT